MKITEETNLHYDYFNGTEINLNNKTCFYYEEPNSMDKYQLIEEKTGRIIVYSETKEELLNYLISKNASVVY